MSIDHIDQGDGLTGAWVFCPFAWEALLPGAQLDSGCTGEVEVWLTGFVLPDGECDDVEAIDSSGHEVDIPSPVYERACSSLVEAAACMGYATR